MIDLYSSDHWLIATGLVMAITLLLAGKPAARRLVRIWLRRLGAWALPLISAEPEADPLAEELAMSWRRERLRCDVQRLQRIMATDMSRSATRQLGNRLAYEQLLRELKGTHDSFPAPTDGDHDNWPLTLLTPTPRVRMPSSFDPQPTTPTVETLEIGWRRC